MTRGEVREQSERSLANMRESGIKFVEVLGCGRPAEDCEACRCMQGAKTEIEFATPLPLPDCDQKFCKCIYIASA